MKPTIPNLILLCILAYLLSCTPTALQNDKVITQHFDPEEIGELRKIIAYFEKEICDNGQNAGQPKSLEECLKQFQQEVEKTGDIGIGIDSARNEAFIQSLSKNLFAKIWREDQVYDKLLNDSLDIITLNITGHYGAFIAAVASKDSTFTHYARRMKATEDISPSMVADVLINYDKFDLKRERTKLILAIHYMTLKKANN